ncbi:MAG: aminopeptidase N, partial [Actinomycetota bacterium]|nr:aminopeptidase N [Actinomycetota bacterium]
MPSLTRAEAERRGALLRVERYDIELDLTGLEHGSELGSRTTVRFACTEPGATTFIECGATEVVSLELNGRSLPAQATDERIPLADLAGDNVLVVDAVQSRTAQRAGIHRSVDPADGQAYVWTTFEPDDAHIVFACFDQPDLKAHFALTVTAPPTWTVVSNGVVTGLDELDGARRWRFADTPRLSTYLPVVNAGPFREVRSTRDGCDLGLFARQSLAPFLERDAEELFALTAAGLAFFADRFGLPFPEPKYDQVFVPEMGGAMENYGCVTWSDAFVYRSRPSQAERELRAVVLLHEMAHMWFGDMVTMRWWDDLWLNEAFAEWAASWAAAEATEYEHEWATFLVTRKQRGYAADRPPTTHPVRQPAPDVATAAAGFDMVTYAKGASVLKQLVAYVGEDAFLAALRAYFQRHQWGNATLEDLAAEVSSASGRDLSGWIPAWLETAGTNALEVVADLDGDAYRDVRIEQSAPPELPTLREHRVALGSYALRDGTLERVRRLPLDVAGRATPVPELAGAPAADLLLLNDDDLTFAEVRLDPRSLDTLLRNAGSLPTSLSRAVAVSTLWSLLSGAELPARDFVRSALDVLRAEVAEPVAEVVLGLTVDAVEQWSGDGAYGELCGDVADLCCELVETGRHRTAALRALARTASADRQLS